MNRICYELQSFDMWLGLPIKAYFSTQKKASEFFHSQCIRTGIITKVRLEAENQKFYEGCTPRNASVKIVGKTIK